MTLLCRFLRRESLHQSCIFWYTEVNTKVNIKANAKISQKCYNLSQSKDYLACAIYSHCSSYYCSVITQGFCCHHSQSLHLGLWVEQCESPSLLDFPTIPFYVKFDDSTIVYVSMFGASRCCNAHLVLSTSLENHAVKMSSPLQLNEIYVMSLQ